MTQDELDKKAGELFTLIKGEIEGSDPRSKEDYQLMLTAAMLGVEFVADVKRITGHLELIAKSITALVDIQAASYQNGIIVKVANELEINTEGLETEVSDNLKNAFKEGAKATEEGEDNDSHGYGDNRTD